jgi:regulatory protein
VAALRLLAQRRLTEEQLRARLTRRGYDDDEVRRAVASCKRDGFVDDALFAQLFVDGRSKAVGNARLVAELVRRGIDRDAAAESVAGAERDQDERLAIAIEKYFRTRPNPSYPSAARALERLGFPAHAIYRQLRARVRDGGWDGVVSDEGE